MIEKVDDINYPYKTKTDRADQLHDRNANASHSLVIAAKTRRFMSGHFGCPMEILVEVSDVG